MGIFSKFRETVVDREEQKGDQNEIHQLNGEESSATGVASSPATAEKGLMESVGEMLQHSANNVKEAVFGHLDSGGDGDIGSLPRALAMEDPFGQNDHVLAAVVEYDVRSSIVSDGHEEEAPKTKTIVQTVRDNLTHSAYVVRDAVLSHTADQPNGNHLAPVPTPVEDGDNGLSPVPDATDEHRRTIIEAMGDIMSHPVQTVKDIIGSYNDVVESSPSDSTSPEASNSEDLGKPKEYDDDGEVKGLMQTVKEAAQEVKEEMMEVVQDVKDVVMSNETLPNVQTESITEDAGERPSMELVHTIVHD